MIGAVTGQKTLYDGVELEDVAGVSLPEITKMTATRNMPGGSVEIPTTLYDSMEISVTFNGLSASTAQLYDVGLHKLEHRYIQEDWGDGTTVNEQLVKVFADVMSKSISPGEPEIGSTQENEATLEVIRFRKVVDGKEELLIDKRTGQVVVNGVDRTQRKLKLLG